MERVRVSVPGWTVTCGGIRARTLPTTPRAVPLLEKTQAVLEAEHGGKGQLSSFLPVCTRVRPDSKVSRPVQESVR